MQQTRTPIGATSHLLRILVLMAAICSHVSEFCGLFVLNGEGEVRIVSYQSPYPMHAVDSNGEMLAVQEEEIYYEARKS